MKRRPESYRSCCHNHPFRRAQIALSKTHPLTAPMGYVEHGRVRLLSPSRLKLQFQFILLSTNKITELLFFILLVPNQRVVEFPAKFSWEAFPANSKICWEGRESTNSKLQVKCNLPRARTATFPDWEHDLATPRGRGRIARQKAERCHGWHGRRPGAHLRGQQQPRFVFEYCEHRVRIAVPGQELKAEAQRLATKHGASGSPK